MLTTDLSEKRLAKIEAGLEEGWPIPTAEGQVLIHELQRQNAALAELAAACLAQHEAIDTLFALLILHVPGFRASESGQPWEALIQGNEALEKLTGGASDPTENPGA